MEGQCDLVWLENLNLRGGFRKTILDWIAAKWADLLPLYEEIFVRGSTRRSGPSPQSMAFHTSGLSRMPGTRPAHRL